VVHVAELRTGAEGAEQGAGKAIDFCGGSRRCGMSSASDDGFSPEYAERVERVCREASSELNSCGGDLLAQLKVCCRYFENGEQEDISHEELIDFLGISSPSILDRAGYSNAEASRVMYALRFITYDKEGKPHPPDSIPTDSSLPSLDQKNFGF
jgi:hypothetical protein